MLIGWLQDDMVCILHKVVDWVAQQKAPATVRGRYRCLGSRPACMATIALVLGKGLSRPKAGLSYKLPILRLGGPFTSRSFPAGAGICDQLSLSDSFRMTWFASCTKWWTGWRGKRRPRRSAAATGANSAILLLRRRFLVAQK